MCLISLAFKQHPDYPLIIAANRDEFYQRPAAAAHYWEEHPHIFAGRDLEAGGTWMGVNRQGRFAALTNFRQGGAANPSNPSSRGALCYRLLKEPLHEKQLLTAIDQQAHEFSGFNVFAGNTEELFYTSNRGISTQALMPGIYGLSNGLLDSDWPKVNKTKQALAELIKNKLNSNDLLAIMADRTVADDHKLPSTGIDTSTERLLSSCFIQSESYGTRCSTAILFHRNGGIEYTEQSFDQLGRASTRITENIRCL